MSKNTQSIDGNSVSICGSNFTDRFHLLSFQLATAVENLKHIFTVPEGVRKTEELINEGKLLQAHKQ